VQEKELSTPMLWTCFERIDSTQSYTLPVKLEELTIQVFTAFLNTFKKKVKRGSNEAFGDEELEIRLKPSSFDGACSSLSHLFQESGIDKDVNEVTKELWSKIVAYKKGTRRISAREHHALGLSASEGKKPLSFRAYRYLARVLFESGDPEHIAAHTFLLLEWNLISRAEFVVGAKVDLVSAREDALVFEIGKTKTDQEGKKNIDHPWHLYANPTNPYICCVLAMARLFMANPTILSGNCPLFEGTAQYERFNQIFLKIVKSPEHRDTFAAFGMPPEDFGTHSIRKGAVTLVATGTTSCPPIASICLRANWAMPGVMNRYIKFEGAGDQFVGRCVAGLPRLSKEFATSPAYFDLTSFGRDEREGKEAKLHEWIKGRVPEAAKTNERVFSLLKMCLAAVVNHKKFLKDNLHAESRLRASLLFIEIDDIPLADCVCVKHPWSKTDDTPRFTGIPADIMIMAEFESLKEKMKEMSCDIQKGFESTLTRELDSRGVGGPGYQQSNEILTKLDTLLHRSEERLASELAQISTGAHGNDMDFGGAESLYEDDDKENEVVIPIG